MGLSKGVATTDQSHSFLLSETHSRTEDASDIFGTCGDIILKAKGSSRIHVNETHRPLKRKNETRKS
jgi:hypothetical protein